MFYLYKFKNVVLFKIKLNTEFDLIEHVITFGSALYETQ